MRTVSIFFDNYNMQTGDKLKEKPNYSVKAYCKDCKVSQHLTIYLCIKASSLPEEWFSVLMMALKNAV